MYLQCGQPIYVLATYIIKLLKPGLASYISTRHIDNSIILAIKIRFALSDNQVFWHEDVTAIITVCAKDRAVDLCKKAINHRNPVCRRIVTP